MRYGKTLAAALLAAGILLATSQRGPAAQPDRHVQPASSWTAVDAADDDKAALTRDRWLIRQQLASRTDVAAGGPRQPVDVCCMLTGRGQLLAEVAYASAENIAMSAIGYLVGAVGLVQEFELAQPTPPPSPPTPPKDGRSPALDAIQAAKNSVRPLSAADLDAARREVDATLGQLRQFLGTNATTLQGWESYLQSDALRAELAKGAAAKPDVLRDIADRYRSGASGLEMPQFINVRRALRHYAAILAATQSPDSAAWYRERLDKLADGLARYGRSGNIADAEAASAALGDIYDTRLADVLLKQVWTEYDKPNLYIRASADFMASAGSGDLDENDPKFHDTIEGTNINGTTHTVGKRTTVLLPGSDYAVLQIRLTGTTTSNTVGVHPPVTVSSTGTTTFTGTKTVYMTPDGFTEFPATATACTQTCITGINVCGGRLAQRIAPRRVYEAKPQAEYIGARHAEQRVARRIDESAKDNLETQDRNYKAKLRDPLMRWAAYPNLRYSSTPEAMWIVARESGPAQLGAPAGPTQEIKPGTLGVQLHESFINNITALTLAGRTVDRPQLEGLMRDLFGEVPKELADDQDQDKQWTITFAKQRPITVTFGDGGYSITIRGTRYTSTNPNLPDQEFRGGAMNISASYKFDKGPNGPIAVRQGELKFEAPDLEGQPLPASRTVERRRLNTRFGKILKPTMEFNGLEFRKAPLSNVGRLVISQLNSDHGWLTVSWVKDSGS